MSIVIAERLDQACTGVTQMQCAASRESSRQVGLGMPRIECKADARPEKYVNGLEISL